MFKLFQRRRDQRRVGATLVGFQGRHAGVIDELHAAADERHDAARSAGNVNQIQIDAVFLVQPRFFGNHVCAMEPEIAP